MKIMNNLKPINNFISSNWDNKIPSGCLVDRDEVIIELCKSKSVLHVGAADSPFHEEKAKAGALLHQKLNSVNSDVLGVDVDEDAVNVLKKYGVNNIQICDIISENSLSDTTFDLVLCCDVIEHVDEPGRLLEACARYLKPNGLLVVSTINATALKPASRAFFGREAVHPDHIFYFSFSTLCQLLLRRKLIPKYFGTFLYPTVNRYVGVILSSLISRKPGLADGILFVAEKSIR
jgi:2-polyprenyl-3-methyl-5-hydroxy-6-metoxy-1,4-benzoquinol methylase